MAEAVYDRINDDTAVNGVRKKEPQGERLL